MPKIVAESDQPVQSISGPIMLRNTSGPDIDPTLDRILTQLSGQFLVLFFAATTSVVAVSAKNWIFKPAPQKLKHYCEHSCTNSKKYWGVLVHFGGGGLPCPFLRSFLLGKNKDKEQNRIQISKASIVFFDRKTTDKTF